MPASLSVVTVVQSKPVFTVFSVHYEELRKFEELLLLKVRNNTVCVLLRISCMVAIGYDHAWPTKRVTVCGDW